MSKRTKYSIGLVTLLALLVTGTVSSMGTASAWPTTAQTAQAPGKLPNLGRDILLPGDSVIGPAAGDQAKPQIAAGANSYLVVWEDSRANALNIMGNQSCSGGESCGQTLKDIYAARLDANGQLIDTIPIGVSQATWDQTSPQVSWNGQNWLVVWNTQRVANFSSTTDVVAARVSPQGALLDTTPIVVDGNPSIDELYPIVASDGNDWVVVWMDQGSYFELDATRISPEGAVRDPGGVPIYTPGFPDAPYNASIAFAGDEYLIAMQQWGSSDDNIEAIRITPTLQRIGGVTVLSSAVGYQTVPEVASNGTDFFVVWSDARFAQDLRVFGTRVNHAGQALDPSGIDISGNNGGYPSPEVIWDGTQWIATWDNYSTASYAARISTSGVVLDPAGVLIAPNSTLPALAPRPGGGAQIVWDDMRADFSGDIYSGTFSAGGVTGPNLPVSLGAPSQRQPDLAPNGAGYLSVFMSEISGETRIKAQRVNADGTAIDQEPIVIAGGSRTLRYPRVAWNGTLYLIVWEDTSVNRGYVSGAIFGKRMDANGVVLDANPFEILPGNFPDVAALGDTFLTVSSHEPTNHQRFIKSVRVGANGTVQGSPATIGNNFARYPKVVPLGARWLATWQRNPTHDNPAASIQANFVNADGTPTGEFNVASSTSRRPDVGAGPDQALIAFYRGGDVYARRIQPDGTFLDGSPGIQVTSAANDQFVPAVAWDGSEYVVAYEDYRNVLYLDRPVSDIYGTRVGANGVVLDSNGFVIANDYIPEVNPVVGGLNGSYLIGYADFKYQAPYAAYRINVRYGQAGGLPTPEPSRTATLTATATPPTCIPGNFAVAQSTGAAIVPGITDTGNHCDECATLVSMPFPFRLYDQTYNTVEVTANGTMNFVYSGNTGGVNFCLPYSGLGYSIIPHWDDLTTDGPGLGVFTSISGVAPNRIFNIEWRTEYYWVGGTANFEVRLYEGSTEQRFDVIFGMLAQNGSGATVGVQKDTGTRYTQYECNTGGLSQGMQLTFTMQICPTATPGVPTNTPGQPTSTATRTATVASSSTTTAIATSTNVAATSIATNQATSTPGAATSTATAIATATACTIAFTDVPQGHTFYPFVRCLACQNILGGYDDGTFRPDNLITRGQIAKIVSNAAVLNDDPGEQMFEDVPVGNAFYVWVNRLSIRGYMGGYPCGGEGEPCGSGNKPYFRPFANATRGQITKIVSNAAGFSENPGEQMFEDVAPDNAFYVWIQRLASRGVMGGYPCGGLAEPCGAGNKPYFRPYNNTTRGQTSKIVSSAFFPQCNP